MTMATPYHAPYQRGYSLVAVAADASVPWPAGHRIGDLMIVAVNTQRGGSISVSANPTGWSLIANQNVDAGTSATADHQTSVYVCRATSTSMATPVFSNSSSTYVLAVWNHIRGASQAGAALDAIDVYASAQNTNGLNTVTWPSVTTISDDCLLLWFVGFGEGDASCSAFACAACESVAERLEAETLLGDDGSIYMASAIKTPAGATGAATATPFLGARAQSRFTIAIRPPQLDTTAPTVTYTPASGSIAATASVQIDSVDAFGDGLAQLNVLAIYSDGTSENVYSNDTFGAKYSNGTNALSSITNGSRLVVKRDGAGWPTSGLTLRTTATDKQGNRTVSDAAFTVTGFFVASSPVVGGFSPAPGALTDGAPIQLDVTDADADLARIMVYAELDDGSTVLVHDGLTSGFLEPYLTGGSTNNAITNGRRITIEPGASHLSTVFDLTVVAVDAGGRTTTATASYAPSYVAPPPGDTTPPTLVNLEPADGAVRAQTVISFDLIDETELGLVAVVASFPDGSAELIHDGEGFRGNYLGSANLRTAIAGGFHYAVRRDGGWRSSPTLEWFAVDASGNIGVIAP